VRHLDLPVSDEHIASGLKTATWPARLMPLKSGALRALLPAGHELWLDGGHNEAGGAVLAEALMEMQRRDPRPLILIFGTFANKDSAGYLSHFKALTDTVLTVGIRGDRLAFKPAALAKIARQIGFDARPARSISAALTSAAAVPNARVVICGALHLAGNVLKQNRTPPA